MNLHSSSNFRFLSIACCCLVSMVGCNSKAKLAFGRACLEGNTQFVKTELDRGANPNWSIGPSQMTPLMLAACGIEVSHPKLGLKSDSIGRVSIIKLLLSRGADPARRNSGGYGPLFYAQLGNLPQGCKLLVDAGARPDVVEKSGYSPIQYAASEGKVDCLVQLIHGLPPDSLDVRSMPIKPGTTQQTPMMMAASNGETECVKTLLKAGADQHLSDQIGTALTYAAVSGHLNVVDCLLQAGSNIEEPAGNGSTPLKKAAYGGFTDLVEYLLSRGAKVNATDKHGRTALMEAAYKGHTQVVELLLRSKASVDLVDDKGEKAFDIAIASQHPEVASIISKWK